MNKALLSIVATECGHAFKKEDSLEAKLKAAFKVAKDHWMATEENDQFTGAVAAVLMATEGEDKDRLEKEMKALRALNAAMTGVPVDFSAMELPEKPLGLMAMWKAA